MKAMEFRNRWVLVTGASSGLGRDMARLLARDHGANLILVARRVQRLRDLARELEERSGIDVRVIEADLSSEADVERVYREACDFGDVYGVVLNAGVTHFGKHADLSWPAFRSMLATNVTSVVRLTSLFIPYLMERNQQGGVMIVGSLAGITPVPYQSAYAGTKAFLSHFVRSLSEELSDANASITLFAPGGIATELSDTTGLSKYFDSSLALMESETCARLALQAFKGRKRVYVPGWNNKLSMFFARLVPEAWATKAVGGAYRRALASLSSGEQPGNTTADRPHS
jgi:short-subunit dehydrogenase